MWLVTLCYSSILSCGYFCILSPGYSMFFVFLYCDHRDIHVLTASFPTRRSSDLPVTSLNAPRLPGGFGWLMPELFRAFDIICFCKHQRHGGIEACRARRWTVIRRCGEPARQQRNVAIPHRWARFVVAIGLSALLYPLFHRDSARIRDRKSTRLNSSH